MNRRLIPVRSFTLSAYAKTFNIENVILLQALSSTSVRRNQVSQGINTTGAIHTIWRFAPPITPASARDHSHRAALRESSAWALRIAE